MAAKTTADSASIRAGAARGVLAVTHQNRTIDWILEHRPQWVSHTESTALLYGTLRHLFYLRNTVATFLHKPFRDKDLDLYSLLLVGAYQLLWSDKPVHAIINETVSAASKLRKPWAKGLINAVLRRLAEVADSLNYPDQTFDHPPWLLQTLQQDYPHQWQQLAMANNTQAPMVLRVNLNQNTRQEYATLLTQHGIAHQLGVSEQAIVLEQPLPSHQLPGWQQGKVAVQDMGAQYAATVLHNTLQQHATAQATQNGQLLRVLDACAAPGGKLAHFLELCSARPTQSNSHIETIAIDISQPRIDATQGIFARLGHHQGIQRGDACQLDWWDRQPFDYVLMDAPCSGTGTIRRHPDIKVLLSADAISSHSATQLSMLHNLWQTLAPGGTLLYCTCSLLQAENDAVISRFLETNNKHANVQQIQLPSGFATRHGWQLLPTESHTDGFYYALLHKQ